MEIEREEDFRGNPDCKASLPKQQLLDWHMDCPASFEMTGRIKDYKISNMVKKKNLNLNMKNLLEKKTRLLSIALMVFGMAFAFCYGFNTRSERMEYSDSFYAMEIPDDIFNLMKGKSFKENCTVEREDLRYLHVLHVGFDGKVHEGELVCNKVIAEDLLEIFRVLYSNKYQIEKIALVDEYDADDETSMRANNSSCFNFRFISFTTKVSKHGLGVAVDINPLYNPYIKKVEGRMNVEPATAVEYVDRSKDFPHKLTEEDLCCRLFAEHGFEWGGDWTSCKDYQHFELPDERLEELGL